ncbi:hypothetical protein CQA14_26870, partial [Escherichia coli]
NNVVFISAAFAGRDKISSFVFFPPDVPEINKIKLPVRSDNNVVFISAAFAGRDKISSFVFFPPDVPEINKI